MVGFSYDETAEQNDEQRGSGNEVKNRVPAENIRYSATDRRRQRRPENVRRRDVGDNLCEFVGSVHITGDRARQHDPASGRGGLKNTSG